MGKQFFFNTLSLLLMVVSISCVSGQQYKDPEFENFKIYPAVTCAADTNTTYALFLPPQYKSEKPCPILILFAPGGNGLVPVTLFSAEAANSGFIIAGSNNSKNGMTFEQTTAIYRKMLADLTSRFHIEKKAVYVGGFSGGSRVAGAVAITEGGVAGVVGCGAGLPAINRRPVGSFSYLAVVGNQDFNYSEMQQFNKMLESASYQHHLLVFEGIHQWPPKELIPDIFTWLRFDAMRQQAILADRTEINSFIEKNDKIAGSLTSKGQLAMQQEVYIKMLHYLHGLTDIAPLQAEIKRLSEEKEVVAFHKQQEQLLDLEQELQQKYLPELQLKNVEWWADETNRLRSLTKKPGKSGANLVYSRLLGFLSMECYMYSTNNVNEGKLTAAERFIEIYRLVDPTNAEHRFKAAKVAALRNNSDAVFNALNQAFELGFTDIDRIKSDAAFKPYLEDERVKSLLNRK